MQSLEHLSSTCAQTGHFYVTEGSPMRPSTTHKLHNTISYDILTFVHLCSVPTYLAYRDHQMSRLFKLLH